MQCDDCGKKRKVFASSGIYLCLKCITASAKSEAKIISKWKENKGITLKKLEEDIIANMTSEEGEV